MAWVHPCSSPAPRRTQPRISTPRMRTSSWRSCSPTSGSSAGSSIGSRRPDKSSGILRRMEQPRSPDIGPPLRRLRLVIALALALSAAAGTITPASGASGFSQNLFQPGDFVRQTNLVQCVGTSMQMMINMIAPANDRSAATQLRLQDVARAYSNLLSPRPGRKGASVWGWASGLNRLGYGPYVVAGFPTIDYALHAAAGALRF